VARFTGAQAQEVVLTKNATEALNLVASSFSNAVAARATDGVDPLAMRFTLWVGDEIVITEMEHHVPIRFLGRNLCAAAPLCAG